MNISFNLYLGYKPLDSSIGFFLFTFDLNNELLEFSLFPLRDEV
jgi:hypothetical protein